MALSFYSNWETLDHLNPETGLPYDHQSEVADALIGFCDPIDLPIDSLFDPPPDDLFNYIEADSNLVPSFSDPSILSLPPNLYPTSDDYDFCLCRKRPRSCSDLYHPPANLVFEANFYSGPSIEPAMSGCQSTEFAVARPAAGCNGEKKAVGGGCLSAQSVAARERRKRISEKTQELGRLIPGGTKMNTAEMFQAAFSYVKFLQAQVGILELMSSIQGKGSPEVEEQLQTLLTSPTIQEKLYCEGRCIVSKEAVEALAEDSEIKSRPLISKDLDRIVESMV